ncbi:polyketide cyclase [Gordonia sp. JH63]|uniref:SRPBCC domain-containing protein n=1 Tax=Gordonia hongkongensis TaxID=1701090 RepID=A0AAX3TA55_9ACTN|nr:MULTISPECIES: SRPBCC domain-containing protein [Gordonia]MCZ4534596.1 SRPBCC domain-containing protein [Gordonia terrae]MBR7195169.1 SRPBCC domain-containing protein [Gordonia sp. SCSIO 19800]QHD85079.1 polyketide cyclase [Gordonia sp. JH63]QIK48977.1 polyketide cyclase [Gordonia terrae]UCZ89611.1 SRPBCC domain-containing protein [Gordonia sp. WA4-43]
MTATQTRYPEAAIEADKEVPLIRITRDFRGTPAQLMKAHTDPELFVRWVGPDAISSRVIEWDVRDGGSWSYVSTHEGQEFGFRGCFHTVGEDKIVQTFTFLGMPDAVSLETLWFEDLGDGTTRLHAQSLCDSFEARDGWLASGMEVGVNEGYAALDRMLTEGEI